MTEFDKIVDELVSRMNEENIPKDVQISYLKELSKYMEIDHNIGSLIIGCFVSGMGIGMLAFPNDLAEVNMSILFILVGIIISLCVKNQKNDINLRNFREIEALREQIEAELKEEVIITKIKN